MSRTPALSIVLPTWNRRELLRRTLPSVLDQDGDFELVVVDDGSSDGTAEWLMSQRFAADMRVAEADHQGQAAALNAGLRAARAPLALLLDDDLVCEPGLVQSHIDRHSAAGRPSVVFGQVDVAEDSPAGLGKRWAEAEAADFRASHTADQAAAWPTDAMLVANTSFPRCALLDAGGFDERMQVRGFDTAAGLALWQAGLSFVYEPRARCRQVYTKSAARLLNHDAPEHGRSELLLARGRPDYRAHALPAGLAGGSPPRRRLRLLAGRMSPAAARAFGGRLPSLRLLRAMYQAQALHGAAREAGGWRALDAEFGVQLPVLMYHRVGPPRPGTIPDISVSADEFAHHIRWLRAHGYRAIRPSDWLAWRRHGTALPAKPVLITFDDGYRDVVRYASPVLQRAGFAAGMYVVSGLLSGRNSWDEGALDLITEDDLALLAAGGIEIGAHSRTHRDLTALPLREAESEIAGSAGDLQALTGVRPATFAYPFGWWNPAVRQAVGRHFPLAFGVNEGRNSLKTDPLLQRRVMIEPGDGPVDLGQKLAIGRDVTASLAAIARRRLLGQRV